MFFRWFYLALICAVVGVSNCDTRVAVAHLNSQQVTGSILFTETESGLKVTGTITGLPAGKYGLHVHELGDTSTCDATGAHFNPEENTHGGREHDIRHVGDLGNVEFVGDAGTAIASVDFVDSVITLRGPNSVLGRTVVLHEAEDDLGLGGDETSLATGNAGARIACGVIGIKSPADPWNSGTSVVPSVLLFILAAGIIFSNLSIA